MTCTPPQSPTQHSWLSCTPSPAPAGILHISKRGSRTMYEDDELNTGSTVDQALERNKGKSTSVPAQENDLCASHEDILHISLRPTTSYISDASASADAFVLGDADSPSSSSSSRSPDPFSDHSAATLELESPPSSAPASLINFGDLQSPTTTFGPGARGFCIELEEGEFINPPRQSSIKPFGAPASSKAPHVDEIDLLPALEIFTALPPRCSSLDLASAAWNVSLSQQLASSSTSPSPSPSPSSPSSSRRGSLTPRRRSIAPGSPRLSTPRVTHPFRYCPTSPLSPSASSRRIATASTPPRRRSSLASPSSPSSPSPQRSTTAFSPRRARISKRSVARLRASQSDKVPARGATARSVNKAKGHEGEVDIDIEALDRFFGVKPDKPKSRLEAKAQSKASKESPRPNIKSKSQYAPLNDTASARAPTSLQDLSNSHSHSLATRRARPPPLDLSGVLSTSLPSRAQQSTFDDAHDHAQHDSKSDAWSPISSASDFGDSRRQSTASTVTVNDVATEGDAMLDPLSRETSRRTRRRYAGYGVVQLEGDERPEGKTLRAKKSVGDLLRSVSRR